MPNSRLSLLALAACPSLCLAADKAPTTIRPIDECSADRSFAVFLRRFDAAVASRDAPALLQLVSPKIVIGFGGDDGIQAFKRQWKLGSGSSSPIWSELKAMRALGCAREAGMMVMPRLAMRLPETESFPGAYAPVRAPVPLHSRPLASAPVRGQLNWDIVYATEDNPGDWLKVRTAAGVEGFVRASDVRNGMNLRVYFERIGGRWMVTNFVSGD